MPSNAEVIYYEKVKRTGVLMFQSSLWTEYCVHEFRDLRLDCVYKTHEL